MASFLIRTLEAIGYALPMPRPPRFDDVSDSNVHVENIRRLADIGMTEGVTEDRYAPAQSVSRAQMATFLLRAYAYAQDVGVETLTVDTPAFGDTEGLFHQPFIAGAADLGLVEGVTEGTYDPSGDVSREQMATFVARLFGTIFAFDAECESTSWRYSVSCPTSSEVAPSGFTGCAFMDRDECTVPPPSAELPLDFGVSIIVFDVVPGRTYLDVGPADGEGVEYLWTERTTVDGREATVIRSKTTGDNAGIVIHEWRVDLRDFALVASTYDTSARDGDAEPWFEAEAATLDAIMVHGCPGTARARRVV